MSEVFADAASVPIGIYREVTGKMLTTCKGDNTRQDENVLCGKQANPFI